MNFKGVRPLYREISSIFVSMTYRVNNIMLLNTPARARLITGADFLYGYASQISRTATADFSMWGKKFKTILFTDQSRALPGALLCFPRIHSYRIFAKYTRGSSVGKRRYLLTVWRNHCLRLNVYGNTHCIEIEDAMSDPARAHSRSAPGYARNFRRCGCRAHSREENIDDKIRNRIYSAISIANPFWFGIPQSANFQVEK